MFEKFRLGGWKTLPSYQLLNETPRDYEFRESFLQQLGFGLLNQDLVKQLSNLIGHRQCIEIGAGLGALSFALQTAGVNIQPYDKWPIGQNKFFPPDAPPFTDIRQGEIQNALAENPASNVVVMSWPDQNREFALEVATALPSNMTLIVLGEAVGGCTADEEYFRYVGNNYSLLAEESEALNAVHVSFDRFHDRWSVLQKKNPPPPAVIFH